VAVRTARKAIRSAALWGVLFGVLVANEALGYHASFPDRASRETFAATMTGNHGIVAVTGPARRLDTLDGFVSWRMMSLMMMAGAVWGLLTATRLLRGEEAAGRWDLYVVGRTSRRDATTQALAGLAVAWGLLWLLTATGTVVAGLQPRVAFPVSGALLYAATGTAAAAIFLAVGAVTSQLTATRRQANALGGAVLGIAWGVRMLADGGVLPAWARWLSPLGWVENVAPLTGPQPWALLPVVVLVVGCGWCASLLAGRRDVAEGVLARRTRPRSASRLITGPGGLAVRLERWTALAWILSLSAAGFVFGLVARAAEEGSFGTTSLRNVLGDADASQAAGWVGYEFLYLAAILSFAAVGQISAMRGEESDGHLDHLVGRDVSRRRWLAQRVGLAELIVLLTGLATGLGGWAGIAGSGGVGIGDMLGAGLNTALPGLVVVGFGACLFGLAPRLAAPLLYSYVLWSFLVELFGSSVAHIGWLARTSVLDHLGPVPAAGLDWPVIGVLVAASLLATVAGLVAFERRDLVVA